MHHQLPAKTAYTWAILPCFLLRSTGFPFEWLHMLRMPQSQQSCQDILQAQTHIKKLQADFSDRLFPQILEQEEKRNIGSALFRNWYKLNRAIQKNQACPPQLLQTLSKQVPELNEWLGTWHDALSTAHHCQQVYQQQFENDLQLVRSALHEMAQDSSFQEAVWLSNPNMYTTALSSYFRHYQSEKRPSKMRYLERQLYAYLQRFCAKNDTTSFFGPIDYGWIDLYQTLPLTLARQPNHELRRRLTRLGYWAAQALADAIAADPAVVPYLTPRLNSGCCLQADGILHLTAHNRHIRLPQALVTLLQHVDGQHTMQEIQQQIGVDQEAQMHRLVGQGLVDLGLKIPTAVFDPLDWLYTWLNQLPAECRTRDAWQQHLAQFSQQITRFATAPLNDKQASLHNLETDFKQLTQQAARRGSGEIYADRLLVYDEAQGDITTCTIGTPLQTQISTQLGPTLDLCASYSTLVQAACQKHAKLLFKDMVNGDGVPYLAFVHQLNKALHLEACLADPSIQHFVDQLVDRARCSIQYDGIVRLKTADLQPLFQPIPPGTMVSPDIFLNADDPQAISAGAYQITIGEIHYGAQVWCHFLTFCEQKEEIAAALDTLLPEPPPGYRRADMVYDRRQGKTFYLEMPGLSVEVRGRSLKPASEVLPVSALKVVLQDDQLRLQAGAQMLELYPGDPRAVSSWLFGTPPVIAPSIQLGTRTPRIEIEGVIFQRAAWHLSTAAWLFAASQNQHHLMQHFNTLRCQHQLPQRGFVRLPQERKPFYIDFANQFSLEFLATMIQDKPSFTFTELLPTETQWWLKGASGTRSCEWRMTMIYGNSRAN